jgi:hypothetical protein
MSRRPTRGMAQVGDRQQTPRARRGPSVGASPDPNMGAVPRSLCAEAVCRRLGVRLTADRCSSYEPVVTVRRLCGAEGWRPDQHGGWLSCVWTDPDGARPNHE